MKEITIAEGLNEVKRIYDLIIQRADNIRKYSSKVRKEPDELEHQQEYVDNQRKSAEDLIERYLTIKTAIAQSNLSTSIKYVPESGNLIEMSVARALLFKQEEGGYEMFKKLYQAFSTQTSQQQVSRYLQARAGSTQLTEEELEKLDLVPHRFYDETEIMQELEDLEEFRVKLDVLLDASNHRTTISI